jgi:hypothetical protein
MKNKYDTSVIFLYAIGKENLLPLARVKSAITQRVKNNKYSACRQCTMGCKKRRDF